MTSTSELTTDGLQQILEDEKPRPQQRADGLQVGTPETIVAPGGILPHWGGLTPVTPTLYSDAMVLIAKLERYQFESPDRHERELLGDQIYQTLMTVDGIINRRLAKLVDQACIVADGCKDLDGTYAKNVRNMTPIERECYDVIVGALVKVRTLAKDRAKVI